MYRIGIDLGGTGIKVGVVDASGVLVASASTPTRAALGAEQVLDDMAQCVMNGLNFAGLGPEECIGIGVGAPGSCDAATGTVRSAYNLGWKENTPVGEMLRRRLGLPVFLANDADCAALGEATFGAAKGFASALLITLGTGVGSGYVLDGRLRSGHRSLGGEAGHMCIEFGGERCTCGRTGCWEAYAGTAALIRQARAAASAHPNSALNGAVPDGKTVFALARAGDTAAQTVVAQYADYVGVGLVNLINLLFPEIVLLGGGLSGAGDALLEPVRAYVRSHCFVRDAALLPELRIAALGSDAGMLGAAALVPALCKG